MNKLNFLIGIFCLASACNQSPSSTENNNLITSSDKLQSKMLSKEENTEIDVVTVSPDKYKVVLENEHVRVIQYTLKPGEKDNPHTHPPKTSYVISGGTFRVYPENEQPFDYVEVEGVSEWSDKTSKHYVENIGNTTISILLTEIKSAQ
jgi:beta-alanine degradation protein BauB